MLLYVAPFYALNWSTCHDKKGKKKRKWNNRPSIHGNDYVLYALSIYINVDEEKKCFFLIVIKKDKGAVYPGSVEVGNLGN